MLRRNIQKGEQTGRRPTAGRPQPPPRCRGITLVETLAVVFIVALLASLLFPFMSKTIERSRETECVHRMRQIGMAFHTYAADNDQKLPVQTVSGTKNMKDSDAWPRQLYTYTETYRIMACPSSPKATLTRIPNTYCYNGNVALIGAGRKGGANHNPLGLEAARLTMSKEPSKDVLLIDNYSTTAGSAIVDGSAQTSTISSSPQAMFPHPRPKNGNDQALPTATRAVLYVDGNVGLLRPVTSDQIALKNWEWPTR